MTNTVGVTTNEKGTRLPGQRKCFYAQGLFWVFYHDGANIVFRTSPDGINWSIQTIVGPTAGNIAAYFSLFFDGVSVHYARSYGEYGDMGYRKGAPNPDGTITWAAEQLIHNPLGFRFEDVSICVDSYGYPWISFIQFDNKRYPQIIRSETNDGTWVTSPGYPLILGTDGENRYCNTQVVPLTGGKIYVVWGMGNPGAYARPLYGRLYDPAIGWGPIENVSISHLNNTWHGRYAAISVGDDDVHVAFLNATNDVIYVKRTWGVGWSSEEIVQPSTTNQSSPVIIAEGNTIYVLWAGAPEPNHIYYRIRDVVGWGSVIDWIDETVDTLTRYDNLSAARDYLGAIWLSGTTEPYDVRHGIIFEEPPPPEHTLTISSTTGGSTNPAPGPYSYPEGTVVTVQANPDPGYTFSHWLLDGNELTDNPIDVTMNVDHTLEAVFEEIPVTQYNLVITSGPGGSTEPIPGTHIYDEDTLVTVTATAEPGYYFDHWILDGVDYTTNPINVQMTSNRALHAVFTETEPPPPPTYNLEITSTIGGITNPAPSTYTYDSDSIATVEAIPSDGYYFNHWQLDGAVRTENPIDILMNQDHTLHAIFTATPPAPPLLSPENIAKAAAAGLALADIALLGYYVATHIISKH